MLTLLHGYFTDFGLNGCGLGLQANVLGLVEFGELTLRVATSIFERWLSSLSTHLGVSTSCCGGEQIQKPTFLHVYLLD